MDAWKEPPCGSLNKTSPFRPVKDSRNRHLLSDEREGLLSRQVSTSIARPTCHESESGPAELRDRTRALWTAIVLLHLHRWELDRAI